MRNTYSFGFLRLKQRKTGQVSVLATLLVCLLFGQLQAAEPILIESNQQFCQWKFAPGEPFSEQDDSLNPTGRLLVWSGMTMRNGESLSQPQYSFYLALPPGAEAKLTVLGNWKSTRSFGLPSRSVVNPEIQSLLRAPEISVPESWRNFRLVRVDIPLQTGDSRQSQVLDSVYLRADFVGGNSRAASYSRDESMLDLVALNSAIASRWWSDKSMSRALDGRLDSWPEFPLYRLAISESGLYLMTGSFLRGRGVNLIGQPSSAIKILGNGGRLLNPILGNDTLNTLLENAIIVRDGGDGRFDEADSILFYGAAPKGFFYCRNSHLNDRAHQSPFVEETAYFIGADTEGPPGLRMSEISTTSAGTPVTQTAAYEYLDNDEFVRSGYYFPESGLVWFMSTLANGESRTFSINVPNAVSAPGRLRLRLDFFDENFQGAASFDVYFGDSLAYDGGSNIFPDVTIPASWFQQPGAGRIRVVNNSASGTVYVNWVEVEFTRQLVATSGQIAFQAPTGSDLYRYSPDGVTATSYFLDITNPLLPRMARGASISDSSLAASSRRYYALNTERIRTPLVRGQVQRTATDYSFLRDTHNAAGVILLTYDDWYDDLEPLKAFHETYREEPLTTVRVKIGDVFDEFGWGNRDPVAIRDFLNYAFDFWRGPNGQSHPPKYVIFVGDGDYDYRNLSSSADDNWMPPWQDSGNCYDAFYCRFGSNDIPDLISGRLPVRDLRELQNVIEKTIEYANTPYYGPWKATATFAADDEWKSGNCGESIHMTDSERLMNDVLPEYFTFKKIYESLYPFRVTSQGRFKPDATRDLIEAINRGTLLINYAGHGNAHIWTDEQMFVMERDYPLIDNERKWPLFIAGTCTWGQYDAALTRCFPELILVDRNDGAIASIAATRYTTVGQNIGLVNRLYTDIFRQGLQSRRSFGEALTASHGSGRGNDLYHVIGNPVVRLASPEYFARVTSPNDSLQALSLYEISGVISQAPDGPVWETFQGIVEARVFDTEDSAGYDWPRCDNFEIPGIFYYGLPGNAIFRGQASIVNGQFDLRFRVPRDIRFGGRNAKISLYFFGKDDLSPDSADGIGIRDSLLIATAAADESDSIAPAIQAWLEVPSFRNGDLVSATPILHVNLADSSGLNLSGEVGHRITGRLDDSQTEDLTTFFNYELNSYTRGSLEKALGPLSVGEHTLSIEAWDSFNNLNQYEVNFVVGEQGEAGYAIRDVLNWPNPMTDETYFTYFLTQDGTQKVDLKIYTLTGKLLYELKNLGTNGPAYNSNSDRAWDGRDRDGHSLANGVYIYKINAQHENGSKAEATGKLVILK